MIILRLLQKKVFKVHKMLSSKLIVILDLLKFLSKSLVEMIMMMMEVLQLEQLLQLLLVVF